MIKSEIDLKQIEKAIRGLSKKDRLKLIERLTEETWEESFDKLLSRIRARVKRNPITQEEIDEEVETAQREYYAKNRH